MTSLIMSSCCTLRLKRRNAFSRDSPSCSRISAKQKHPQTRPVGPAPRLLGPDSYYKDLGGSQVGRGKSLQKADKGFADRGTCGLVSSGYGAGNVQRSFLGSPRRSRGLRFVRMTIESGFPFFLRFCLASSGGGGDSRFLALLAADRGCEGVGVTRHGE